MDQRFSGIAITHAKYHIKWWLDLDVLSALLESLPSKPNSHRLDRLFIHKGGILGSDLP